MPYSFNLTCESLLQVGGSLAEYAVSSIKTTVKRPENVSALDGAALGIAGQSALQSVRDTAGIKLDGSSNNKNVLITAASGGVGTYAVQVPTQSQLNPSCCTSHVLAYRHNILQLFEKPSCLR